MLLLSSNLCSMGESNPRLLIGFMEKRKDWENVLKAYKEMRL